jgi:hypothetical protein
LEAFGIATISVGAIQMFFEVLVEGTSDIPAVEEIFTRRFNLRKGRDFKIIPHQGKGELPSSAYTLPNPRDRTLLHQLPAKLRGYSHLTEEYCIVVLVDADDDDCIQLKTRLIDLHAQLFNQPPCILFRIAVEEMESWFIADSHAIKLAYPHAKTQRMERTEPDQICGAWELLADAIGKKPGECSRNEKTEWAKAIAPHLDLDNPKSTSLYFFIDGIRRKLDPPQTNST